MRRANLNGMRFGRLTVVGPGHVGLHRTMGWKVKCDCGFSFAVNGSSLRSGSTKSCGCLRLQMLVERSRTHGRSRSHLYTVWAMMIQRCENKRHIYYAHYGGRGIVVCEMWRRSFDAFARDVGEPPSKDLQLDRIDNADHYRPGNVRWSTKTQQARNKRNTRRIVINGVEMSLAEAVERAPSVVSYKNVVDRMSTGWSFDRAISTPKAPRWP